MSPNSAELARPPGWNLFLWEDRTMSTRSQTESHRRVPVLTRANRHDEALDEEFVELVIARANEMRHAYRLPELSVGALVPSPLTGMVPTEPTQASADEGSSPAHFIQ